MTSPRTVFTLRAIRPSVRENRLADEHSQRTHSGESITKAIQFGGEFSRDLLILLTN